jgi:hypothetical protein
MIASPPMQHLEHHHNGRCHCAKPVQLVCQTSRTYIAKSVQVNCQNGSTGLVFFYECHKRVSLRRCDLGSVVEGVCVAAELLPQTGGGV